MIELKDIALLMGAAVIGYFFWRAIAIREQALRAVKRHLKNLNLQLLEDAVALRSVWPRRDKQRNWAIERVFYFEFSSTGAERYDGSISMLNNQVQDIHLEPYRVDPPEDEQPGYKPTEYEQIH